MPRILEIRPLGNGGWQCLEMRGVQPFWIGENAKKQALDYGKERAKTDGSEIRILNDSGEVVEILRFKGTEYQSVAEIASDLSRPRAYSKNP